MLLWHTLRRCRLVPLVLPSLLVLTVLACGDDDSADAGDDGGATAPGDSAVQSTPAPLGDTFTIRGQQVDVPEGATLTNQSQQCWPADVAYSPDCAGDAKLLMRGESYILYDPSVPRVIARKILPEDEGDFRPILNLISGLQAPTP